MKLNKRKFILPVTFCGILAVVGANLTLNDVGIWDNGTQSFSTTLSTGDPIDTNNPFDVIDHASATDSLGRIYTAFIQEDASGNDHVYLNRYDGTKYEVWDGTIKNWTTTFQNATPIDRHFPEQESSSVAIAAAPNDDIYITFVQETSLSGNRKVWLDKYDASANDIFIWDDGAISLTNNLSAPTAATDSISNNTSSNNIASGTPAMGIDSKGDVWISYTQQADNGANFKVWLSKFSPTGSFGFPDAFIWDDGASSLTNDLSAPTDARDSISNNVFQGTNVLGSPTLAIDHNDDIYISYVQEGDTFSNSKVWLSKFDTSTTDAFIWDDGAISLTNNLSAPTDANDSISNNAQSSFNAIGTPSMAIDANNDVWIAYTQQGDANANFKVWLSKFSPTGSFGFPDAFIWDDGSTSLSNNLRTTTDANDSISNNFTSGVDVLRSPALSIDSQGDIYIAYVQEGDTSGNSKVWLSKFDTSMTDAFIWDDGAASLTNNLSAPNDANDSFSVNANSSSKAFGTPSIAIDGCGDVYVAYTQQAAAGLNAHIWLSKFDSSATDVLVWDDGANSLTNNLTAPTAESDAVDLGLPGQIASAPKIIQDNQGFLYLNFIQASSPGGTDHLHTTRVSGTPPPPPNFPPSVNVQSTPAQTAITIQDPEGFGDIDLALTTIRLNGIDVTQTVIECLSAPTSTCQLLSHPDGDGVIVVVNLNLFFDLVECTAVDSVGQFDSDDNKN